MLYPQDIESKLGFSKIRDQINAKCKSTLGQSMVDKLKFCSEYQEVSKLLGQTAEFMHIISSGEKMSIDGFIDVRSALKRSATEGAFLIESDLLSIAKYIDAFDTSIHYLTKNVNEFPLLNRLGKALVPPITLAESVNKKIDADGKVMDEASEILSSIRVALRTRYNQVRKTLQSIFKQAVSNGFVPEGASITVRDGRMVIPILSEYKKRVPGFVHDESATGNTVFLEPTNVLEGNNEIRELEYAEKREIVKILTLLTDEVRVHLEVLKQGQHYLSLLDFIRAKARFAIDIGAVVPQLKDGPILNWENAKHPILKEALNKEGKEIVPLNITLDRTNRLLIISGPNAGGKSVSLKTVGLLQFMLQAGIPIPVDESSQCGIYESIFIDIGDQQSIENDLSTYSSHLRSMKVFLNYCSKKSLCLIDEFGTGTDPQFGGAIAEAVLKELNEKNVYGVITTHYSNIKSFAENNEGIVNGAMQFDMNQLEPLFVLDIGKPGSSFSLEIARKTGLGKSVIDYAKDQIGDKSINVDELLNQLERQQQQIKKRDIELKNKENKVNQLESKYRRLNEELESNKKNILNKAKEEAAQLLKSTNKEIEKTIRHIKSNNAQKSETKKARERLKDLSVKVESPAKNEIQVKIDNSEILVGDTVKLIDQDVAGVVISQKGNDVEVQIGLLKTKVKRQRLEKISRGKEKKLRSATSLNKSLNLTNKFAEFSTKLDIRGKRVEEVIPELERFLDEALLFDLSEVKVLHGKGNGVLREVVRNYAKSQKYIASASDESIEQGGSGITVLSLK